MKASTKKARQLRHRRLTYYHEAGHAVFARLHQLDVVVRIELLGGGEAGYSACPGLSKSWQISVAGPFAEVKWAKQRDIDSDLIRIDRMAADVARYLKRNEFPVPVHVPLQGGGTNLICGNSGDFRGFEQLLRDHWTLTEAAVTVAERLADEKVWAEVERIAQLLEMNLWYDSKADRGAPVA